MCLVFNAVTAQAQADPQALSNNLPVRLKDASVTGFGAVTLQFGSRTTVEDDGRYNLRGGPALKIGLPGPIELSLAPFCQLGDASSMHGNFAGAKLEWNLNRQKQHIPAFLLVSIRDASYGGGHQGPHYEVQGVAIRSLGNGRDAPRLGVEVAWTHMVWAATDERNGS